MAGNDVAAAGPNPPVEEAVARPKLNPEVLKLGFVSFLTDLSSEAIFSVFAVFFTSVAGASSALLGLIEGQKRVGRHAVRWGRSVRDDAQLLLR